MSTDNIMIVLISICAVMMICIFFSKAVKAIIRLCIRGSVGAALIYAVNILLSPYNLMLGINCITASAAALLGIPGIAAMYGIKIILNMFNY